MKMSGSYDLNASREAVWAALNDPEVLKRCIPGCESIDKLSDTEMEAVATTKVGPVKAKFKGKVTLSDLDPPNSYTISGEGQGGAAGFARGGAKVSLSEPEAGRTTLAYDVDATVGGKLAQIGQRLIDGAAKKLADQFFESFAAEFGGAEAAEEAAEAEAEAAPGSEVTSAVDELRQNQARMRQITYLAVVIIAALALYYLFAN